MTGKENSDVDGVVDQSQDHIVPSEPTPEVGYRRPPPSHRFKKGQSGNSRGRPKGRKTFSALFDEVLGKTIRVREQGRWRHISKAEALAKVALHAAIKGNARALNAFIVLAEKAGILTPPPENKTGRYGYLVVPPQATPEEWQKEALEALRVGQERERQLRLKERLKEFSITKDVNTGQLTVRRRF